ncbi:MAG: argininosuccinate lyase [Phycisphaerales bacterium JB039]
MWGGRFASGPAELFRQLNDSLAFDRRLLAQDLQGSAAWARALGAAGVLNPEETERLGRALEQIGAEAAGGHRLPQIGEAEDVHTWVEQRLIEFTGPLGKKLHTGRSRNDQVATDLRLWLREAIDDRIADIRGAQRSLAALAQREAETVFPGYTHLQRAQPITLGHWALAYAEMLDRDQARFADARRRVNVCPLGAAALAGTTVPVDRHALARDLGFDGPSANSLDAIADRDFVLEPLLAAATCAMHLSRLAEDVILYSSGEFGFFELPDGVASGSSLMPQKKNPDGAELIRAKAGRILGSAVSLMTVCKGLPLAYNKDLQEDKEAIFDAMDTLAVCLRLIPLMFDEIRVHHEACSAAAAGGYSNATELADYLVGRGVTFRDAHEIAGRLVRLALERGCPLDGLSVDDMRSIAPMIESDVHEAITLEACLARRDVFGGTAPRRVRQASAAMMQRIEGGGL